MDQDNLGQITQDPTPAPSGESPGWVGKAVLFLAGQAVSMFGSMLVQYAIIWYVTLTTKSGMMIALSTICGFAPQIVISLFAGVWADRYDRKRIIVYADALIAAATLVLAIFFFMGQGQLWMILLMAAIRSFGAGLQSPAVSALIPQIVPSGKLMRVSGINGTIQSLMMLVSPAISGALYALSRIEYIFFIDVGTAVIGIAILLLLKVPKHKKAAEQQRGGYFSDLADGFRYVRSHRYIVSLMRFFALFMFLIVPAAFLTPLMVTRNFGPEVWRLTAIEMLFGGGSALGGVIVAVWGGFKNRLLTISAACVLFGLLNILLGFTVWFWMFLALMFITGFLIPFFNSATTVMLQQKVDPDVQGRVFSLMHIVISSSMPVGTLLFGPAADWTSIESLLIGTGVVLAGLGVLVWFNRDLGGVEEKAV